MSSADNVIAIRDLRKVFGTTVAVDGVSLTLKKGEIFGFLGPNGAGKTTTIKAAVGLVRLDRGHIEVLGGSIADPSVRRRIGFMPEQPYLPEALTAFEFVLQHALLSGIGYSRAGKSTDAALERVGLGGHSRRRLGTYSKGMQQRAALAQALVGEPELLILDEPMSGLDPIGRRDVRLLMRELRSTGKTIFFSTHIIPDLEATCDGVAVLNDGQVRTTGSVETLLRDFAGDEVQITTSGFAPELEQTFRLQAKTFESIGATTVVTVANTAAANAMIDLLRQHGVAIVSVQPRRRSLEDVLVALQRQERS